MNYIKLNKEYTEPSTKYNVISVVLFSLINPYKDTKKYYDGLMSLIDYSKKILPNFKLRIYYDRSVYEKKDKNDWSGLLIKARKDNNIQLVQYEMPKFKLKENASYHEGLIGTMVRFLLLFDLEENKNIETTMIMDIDGSQNQVLQRMKIMYDLLIKNNLDLIYRTGYCYDLQDRFLKMDKYYSTENAINASSVIAKFKFPVKILNDFFDCFENYADKKCSYYLSFLEDASDVEQNASQKKTKSRFPYGIDELFLIILKSYINKIKLQYAVCINRNISPPIYHVYLNYKNKKISDINFKYYLKNIMKKRYDDNKSELENYNIFDTITYQNFKAIDLQYEYLFTNVQEFYDKLDDNDKIKLFITDKERKCIMEQTLEITTVIYKNVNINDV